MSEIPLTAFAAFSRIMLPGALFGIPTDQDSMLLTGRVSKPFLQHTWKQFCEKTNTQASPGGDAFDTTTKWLGGTLAALVIIFPPPKQEGEAHLALFIIPARPDDGPRRYFTLEKGKGPATVFYEWLPETQRLAFRPIVHAEGIKPELEAFAIAVEKVSVHAKNQPEMPATQEATQPSTNLERSPSVQPAAPPGGAKQGGFSRWLGKLFGKGN